MWREAGWDEFRGAVRPPFIEEDAIRIARRRYGSGFGGQSAPPSLKTLSHLSACHKFQSFGGQSAPPSLKNSSNPVQSSSSFSFGGQSAPPSLKNLPALAEQPLVKCFGGQSAPPSLKMRCAWLLVVLRL